MKTRRGFLKALAALPLAAPLLKETEPAVESVTEPVQVTAGCLDARTEIESVNWDIATSATSDYYDYYLENGRLYAVPKPEYQHLFDADDPRLFDGNDHLFMKPNADRLYDAMESARKGEGRVVSVDELRRELF